MPVKQRIGVNPEKDLSPGKKAKRTGKWAKTITKCLIKKTKTRGPKWRFVTFEGPQGGESTGAVDLIAIRKNHRPQKEPFKRGDLFDIVLIQVKGGDSGFRCINEIARLRKLARRYKARAIIANWVQGKSPRFYDLSGNHLEPEEIF